MELRRLWLAHGCSNHRILLDDERNYGLGMDALGSHRILLEYERNHGLGMDTNGIMVWAWMLQSPYSFGTQTEELWFGHGCSRHRILLKNKRNYTVWAWMLESRILVKCYKRILVWAWMLQSTYSLWACSSHCILLEHKRNYGLGMDAPVSWNTNGMWFGYGCSSHRIMIWACML